MKTLCPAYFGDLLTEFKVFSYRKYARPQSWKPNLQCNLAINIRRSNTARM